jgi:WD40 repeat protein
MIESTPQPDTLTAGAVRGPNAAEQLYRLWRQGDQPDVDGFLVGAGDLSPSEAAAVLRVDQRERWRQGEGVSAEAYLQRHPAVAADAEAALDLIFNEFLIRGQCGDPPPLDKFLGRFPEHAEVLRAQIELHQVVAGSRGHDLGSTVSPGPAEGSGDGAAPPAPPTVPGYEILGEVGRGGMGVIYKARHLALNRLVALKMISAGVYAGPAERARLRTEAEAAARLRHPNVVQVYEVGSADGLPYLALEWMDGGNLAQALNGRPLLPRSAAELVGLLARAVQAAHDQGVVHRDLKPANILFAGPAAGGLPGVPKVADFGLAKDIAGGAGPTASATVLGTPSYMAPEQADGRARDAGPAADVYALGAILYECLTGAPPFCGATPLDILDQVRSREPQSPSRLQPGLPRDLVTVCLKALAKEPARRYASAAALADDLGRFLADRPVMARPVRLWERGWRWCRRNPVLSGVSAVAAALLLALLIGGWVASLVVRERNLAIADRQRAERAERELKVRSHLARAAAYRRSGQPGQRLRCLDELRAALRLDPSPEERAEIRSEAAAALVLPDVEVVAEWEGRPEGTVGQAFDGELRRYARLDTDGTVTLHRLNGSAAEEVARFSVPGPPPFGGPWVSPDGRIVVTDRGSVRNGWGSEAFSAWEFDWQRPELAPKPLFTDPAGIVSAAFRHDGRRLAVGHALQKAVSLYDLETGQRCWQISLPDFAQVVAYQPDGDVVAVQQGVEVLLLEGATGRELRGLRPDDKKLKRIANLAWHPDGRRLAVIYDDARIHLWDVRVGQEVAAPWGEYSDGGAVAAFNEAGDRLLSYDWSRQAHLWDALSGRRLMTLPGVFVPQFSRDGTLLGTQQLGNRLRLWRVVPGREFRVFRHRTGEGLQFLEVPVPHAAGRVLAAVSQEGPCFFDLASGEELAWARLRSPGITSWRGFLSPGGWLMSEPSGSLYWPARPDPVRDGVLRVGPPSALSGTGQSGISFSPDGKILVMADGDGALVLNRDAAAPYRFRVGPQHNVRDTAVSPDKRWVVTCSWWADPVSDVRVWDARTGEPIRELPLRGGTYAAWFSPDNRWLVTTCFGVECRLWEAGTWREVRHYRDAYVAFSPDGRVMALSDAAGQIRLVEPATDREVARLTGPEPSSYERGCFAPDGTRLIAVDRDRHEVCCWDLRAIRAGLRELGLDWDLPPFPPEAPAGPAPRVEVDRGFLAHEADYPDPAAAIALFNVVLVLQPSNPEAYLQRGRAWGRSNHPQEAIADYSTFLALAPDDPRRGDVLFRRANNFDRLGDAEAALRDLTEIARLDPEQLPSPCFLAGCFNDHAWRLVTGQADRRQPETALPLARAAVRLEPDSHSYRNTLGLVYYRLGRWREAVATLEPNLPRDPGQAAWDLYILAASYHHLGDATRAREQFDRAARSEAENSSRLSQGLRTQLHAFHVEAEEVLRGPPGSVKRVGRAP